jgi:hypothetical protein
MSLSQNLNMGENVQEHSISLPIFILKLLLYGFIGFISGSILNDIFTKIRLKTKHTRMRCFFILVLYISLVSLLLFYTLHNSKRNQNIYLDDWVFGTYEGYVFAGAFISSQLFLGDTVQCAFKINL